MPITHIHTFLVHPAKGVDSPKAIGGSEVPLSGKMFDLLRSIYDRSEEECKIQISFNCEASGKQANACRDLIIAYARSPSIETGRALASRLAEHTDNRSRLGLLFLIAGKEKAEQKLIISRFPADSGILAEQSGSRLSLEFFERIFMKSAKSYKAVAYRHVSLSTGFWSGFAVDRQSNDADTSISDYWIADFLDSDLVTTAAAGTKRLAVACRNATRNTLDPAIKSEVAAAVTLASGQTGRSLSIRQFTDRLGLSQASKEAIHSEVKPGVLDDRFRFDAAEFNRQIAYKSLELSNGAVLTAETGEFEKVFKTTVVNEPKRVVRITTEGQVVGERFRKSVR